MSNIITAIHLGTTGIGTERIEQVWDSSVRRSLTVAEVVCQIDGGVRTFRSESVNGPIVQTAVSSRGHKFIRTNANGTQSDNLLSLPTY